MLFRSSMHQLRHHPASVLAKSGEAKGSENTLNDNNCVKTLADLYHLTVSFSALASWHGSDPASNTLGYNLDFIRVSRVMQPSSLDSRYLPSSTYTIAVSSLAPGSCVVQGCI